MVIKFCLLFIILPIENYITMTRNALSIEVVGRRDNLCIPRVLNVFPMSYLEPCFLLYSLRLYFPPPVYPPLILILISHCYLSLPLLLILLAPINSCLFYII